MQPSNTIRSKLFDRVTNRAKPRLSAPTSNEFDVNEWRAAVRDSGELSQRDITLLRTVVAIGPSVAVLRSKYIAGLFAGLSRSQIVTFAIADANRAWAILREKSNASQREHASSSDAVFSSTIGKDKLEVGPNSLAAGSDALNTTFVDTVAHWFARAADAPEFKDDIEFDYRLAGKKGQHCFMLEHVFKEIWQQVLWEPWTISRVEGGFRVEPEVAADSALWSQWIWRDEDLAAQAALLRHFDKSSALPARSPILKTAVAVSGFGRALRIEIGAPGEQQASSHQFSVATMESSYLGSFVDDPIKISEGWLTPRLLEMVVAVLQDLARLLLPEDADVEYQSETEVERLSCLVPRVEAARLISEALGIPSDRAQSCLESLISRPFAGLSAIFKNGLWHRPLVLSEDGESLQLVLGALVWGNPVRRLERWLQDGSVGNSDDMSDTPLGLKYEEITRQNIDDAISGNAVLSPIATRVSAIGRGQAKEEIDGIFRMGSSVFVLEIKCFLAPSDPIERHNYLRKLEKACEQASRKAAWLKQNIEEVERRLGKAPDDRELSFVPLVVLNQGSGSGLRIGDCVVIDAHFLTLYLSSGEYRSAGAYDFRDADRTGFQHTYLYGTAEEAELQILRTFERHPGLQRYASALAWENSNIPLADGTNISMAIPMFDTDAFVQASPKPDELLQSPRTPGH